MKPFGYDNRFINAVLTLRKAEMMARKMKASLYLGFSGGKDSQVIFHLAKSLGIPFIPHHLLTTVEPPEVIRFIKSRYPEVRTIRQPLSMGQLIIKRKTLPTRFARFCCSYFKELKYPQSVVITGVRHEESTRRAARQAVEIGSREKDRRESFSLADVYDKGEQVIVDCLHGSDQLIINPIIDWTEKDVQYFLREVIGVPMCELYSLGFKRVGCICCPLKGYKEVCKDVVRYPKYVDMYIRTIHRLRANSNFFSDHPELSDQQIFDWWIKDVPLQKWMADNVQQLSLF